MKRLLFILFLLLPFILYGQEVINLDAGSNSSSTSFGGGGALAGVATYSNASDDFTVEAINSTKQVYVTGAPFTIEFKHVAAGYGRVYNTSTGEFTDLTMSKATVSGDTITFTDYITTFAATDSVILFLIAQTKAYDTDLNQLLTNNQVEPYTHYTDMETVFDETGLAGSDAYWVTYMASYEYFCVHFNIADSGFVRCFVTNNASASDTDHTSDWVEYSSTIFGSDSLGSNSATTEGMYIQDTPFMPLKIMFRAYSSDDTCAIDGWIRKYY